MMIVTGIAGFLIVFGLGLFMGRPLDESLTWAAIAAFACGWIGRWWIRLWQSNLHQALVRQAQEIVPEAKPEVVAPTPLPHKARG